MQKLGTTSLFILNQTRICSKYRKFAGIVRRDDPLGRLQGSSGRINFPQNHAICDKSGNRDSAVVQLSAKSRDA